MHPFRNTFIGFISLLLLLGCSAQQGRLISTQAFDTAFEYTHWKVISALGRALKKETQAYLRFGLEPGKLVGQGPCNTIIGSYNQADSSKLSQIKIQKIASTLTHCPERAFEQDLMEALERVDSFKIEGNKLKLFTGKQLLVLFQSADPS